jgi:sec-independent protein translocase protein TatC
LAEPEPAANELEDSRAPFMEHLQELRVRVWRALLGVVSAAVICFIFHDEIYRFLTEPLFVVLENRGLEKAVKFRTVTGAFMFHFKSAMLGGVFFGVPVVLHQLWQFVAPGLYKTERRLAIPFVVLSTGCFVGGGAFAYYWVLPEAFDFLLGYAIQDGDRMMLPDITVEDYLGFTTKLLLAFGIVFEMPVGIGFLSIIGLVTHRFLLKYWRYAVVSSFVLAAMLTPPDYITQTMLAVPLCALFGLSIGISYLITVRREAAQAALDDEDGDDDDGDGDDENDENTDDDGDDDDGPPEAP